MIANRHFEHCEPLTWVGRMPVYLATVLAAVHAVTMIITAFAMAANPLWPVITFGFTPASAIQGGHIWQFVTYAFVNPPGVMAAFQIILLALFGRDVEKYLGRKSFAYLYTALILAVPLFLTLLGFCGWSPTFPFAGSADLHFAIFIAFVFLYPSAEIFFFFFGVQARWLGIALFAIYSLQMVAASYWIGLGAFWFECAVVAAWLMAEGVSSLQLPAIPAFNRAQRVQKSFKIVPREPDPEDSVHESVDPILEKIARQGIASLTRSERDRLERARDSLLKKERK